MNEKTGLIEYTTETGSLYEVNYDEKKIRRVTGTHDPTNHQGKDGEWKDFLEVNTDYGYLEVIWRIEKADGGFIVRRTVSSNIVSMVKNVKD